MAGVTPSPIARNNPYATVYQGFGQGTPTAAYKPNNPYANIYRGFNPVGVTAAKAASMPKLGTTTNKPKVAAKNPYDYSGDPILQQVIGNNLKLKTEADQLAADQQRKSLLGFGSVELAKKLFGGDQGFVDAVANNPFSVLGQLKHKYEGVGGLINQTNENLNNQNLFFSSERLNNQLPEVYRQRQQEEYTSTQNLQDALDQIASARTGTYNQTVQNEIQARQDAAQRAVTAALASGYGPGVNKHKPPSILPPPLTGSPTIPSNLSPSVSNLISQKGY